MGDLDLFFKVTDNGRTPAVRRQLWLLRQHGPTDLMHNYANVQPLRQKFFTKGQGHRSRSKSKMQKNVLVTR